MPRWKFRVLAPSGGYTAYAADFAVANPDWMERDAALTGAADGTSWMFSCWFNPDSIAASDRYLYDGTRMAVIIRSTGTVRVALRNTAATIICQLDQDTGVVAALTAVGGWYHIAVSAKNTASGGLQQLYINGTSCATVTTSLPFDDTNFDQTQTDYSIGGYLGGTLNIDGQLREVYINQTTAL